MIEKEAMFQLTYGLYMLTTTDGEKQNGCIVNTVQMLTDNPNIRKVYLCLDNDEVGRKYDARIADKLFEKGIPSKILLPTHKDWNEDLTHFEPEQQTEENVETEDKEAELGPVQQS